MFVPTDKLAKHCGVSNSTVSIYCKDVCDSQTSTDRVTGSDGKSYPATKPRTSKPETETETEAIDNPRISDWTT